MFSYEHCFIQFNVSPINWLSFLNKCLLVYLLLLFNIDPFTPKQIKTPKRIFQVEAKWAKNQFLLLSIPTVWKNRSSFSWGRCWLWLQAVRFTEFLLYRTRCLVRVGQLWEGTTVTTSWGVGWQFEKTRAMRYSASRSRLDMKATATKINIMV